jgi:hypothetical protein
MSEWCGNCHAALLENAYASGVAGHRHPAGNNAKLPSTIVANYNSFVSSGVYTNVDPKRAYSTLAPFELGTNDYNVLAPLARNDEMMDQSAKTSSNVMCLTCHRAYASGFESMTRFMRQNEFMTISDQASAAQYDGSTSGARSAAARASPSSRPPTAAVRRPPSAPTPVTTATSATARTSRSGEPRKEPSTNLLEKKESV